MRKTLCVWVGWSVAILSLHLMGMPGVSSMVMGRQPLFRRDL